MSSRIEHYCTLLDSAFLPQLLCLHASMQRHAGPYRLWVVCLDEEVRSALDQLALQNVSLVPVAEVETQALLKVKTERMAVEYCWTLTPFLFDAVFQREPSVGRVTYLDADLYFFRSPNILLEELDLAGKNVLITEHGYAPEYDQSGTSGRFCVQFMTFDRGEEARAVRSRWQEQCLEWCFNRHEHGKFGDQRYLDEWPTLYSGTVHIYSSPADTLAPWNVRHFMRTDPRAPVFFHFHGLRLIHPRIVMLRGGYHVGKEANRFYRVYVEELRRAVNTMKRCGIPIKPAKIIRSPLDILRLARLILSGNTRFAVLR